VITRTVANTEIAAAPRHAADDAVLCTGHADRPQPIRSALTTQEVVVDAAPAIFAEAFGGP